MLTVSDTLARGSKHEATFIQRSNQAFSDQIQDYELGDVLGKGAFGLVTKAKSLKLSSYGKEVAIKMIDKKFLANPQMKIRIRNEIEILWQLQHPSIMEFYRYFEDEKCIYLVTEYCSNGHLFDYIQNQPNGRLNENQARFVMKQVIQGLDYMHSRSIMHRDLKLSNLLLTKDYDLKIADFGLAVQSVSSSLVAEQTTMCGTPNYIAPEIVCKKPYGMAADVWALGCMIYLCLTGTSPFEEGSVHKTFQKVVRTEYTLPSYLSKNARDLIACILQKDPNKRPSVSKLLRHPFFSSSEVFERPGLPQNTHPNSKNTERLSRYSNTGSKINGSTATTSLPAFVTSCLKSFEQQLKKGVTITINQQKEVIFSQDSDPFIMKISSDSNLIRIYQRNRDNPVESFTRNTLHQKYHKRYQYIYRYINLLKSKTPRIVYHSPLAKCMLMENEPTPDFEVQFNNGDVKVHHSTTKKRLEIKIQKQEGTISHQIDFDNSKEYLHKHPDLIPYIKHTQECLKNCMEIDKEHIGKAGVVYPIILTHPERKNLPVSGIGKDSSSLSTYTVSAFAATTTGNERRSEQNSIRKPPLLTGTWPRNAASVVSNPTSTVLPSQVRRPPSRVSTDKPRINEKIQKLFIDKVGWFLRISSLESSERLLMLFIDGVSLEYLIDQDTVLLEIPGKEPLRYNCDPSLPKSVKVRLRYLKHGIKMLCQ